MNLRFRSRLFIVFTLLVVLFIGIQQSILSLFSTSWFLASMIGFLAAAAVGYAFITIATLPLRRLTDLATTFTPDRTAQEIYGPDEVDRLSKAIHVMGTQLKGKIEEISREKEYLQAVLTGMVEGVLVVDETGRVRMMNESLRKLLSLAPNITNRFPLEVIRNARLESSIKNVIQEGRPEAYEIDVTGLTRTVIEVNVVPIAGGQPAPRGERKVCGAIAVFHDITRLKELEKVRQDFVANVSHELRTPLTTINGYVETLLDGAVKEEVAQHFVEIIKRHTDRLTKIVEDLLALSTIESKEFRLKVEPVSVQELIDDVLEFVKEPAQKKNISISRADMPASLTVQADRNYLEQVFVNLLDNAIKYGREGGHVLVSAINSNAKEIRFAVQDDGIGILKSDLGRIFERFYRVDKGRSRDLGGTGLGLSIVKHIVRSHGGNVWAESEPGKGSTFYFTLPLQ